MAGRSRATASSRPAVAISAASGKERMLHIRVSPDLHRRLRLIVAAQDTSLQDWIAQALESAVDQASPDTKQEEAP